MAPIRLLRSSMAAILATKQAGGGGGGPHLLLPLQIEDSNPLSAKGQWRGIEQLPSTPTAHPDGLLPGGPEVSPSTRVISRA